MNKSTKDNNETVLYHLSRQKVMNIDGQIVLNNISAQKAMHTRVHQELRSNMNAIGLDDPVKMSILKGIQDESIRNIFLLANFTFDSIMDCFLDYQAKTESVREDMLQKPMVTTNPDGTTTLTYTVDTVPEVMHNLGELYARFRSELEKRYIEYTQLLYTQLVNQKAITELEVRKKIQ